jgi:2,3-bisphosphoglycerate-dependent phosphoglycerate mutase
MQQDHHLVLVRHGQSTWNAQNLFTGWRDPELSAQGQEEADAAGEKLQKAGFHFEGAFVSRLLRAQETCRLILEKLGQDDLTAEQSEALNERDYGDLSGLNKDEARKKWGEEQVHLWRRSYAIAPPGGESLRDTVARVLPYYIHTLLPSILRRKNTLVVAHGNSLRSLVMALDGHTPTTITEVEIPTGVPWVYTLRSDSSVKSKIILDGP